MTVLAATRLKDRVTIQQQDGSDAWAPWSDVAAGVPAEVITETGREFVRNAADTAERAIFVRMRIRSDVDSAMRLVWDGEPYRIVSLIRNRRMAALEIKAIWTEGRRA